MEVEEEGKMNEEEKSERHEQDSNSPLNPFYLSINNMSKEKNGNGTVESSMMMKRIWRRIARFIVFRHSTGGWDEPLFSVEICAHT